VLAASQRMDVLGPDQQTEGLLGGSAPPVIVLVRGDDGRVRFRQRSRRDSSAESRDWQSELPLVQQACTLAEVLASRTGTGPDGSGGAAQVCFWVTCACGARYPVARSPRRTYRVALGAVEMQTEICAQVRSDSQMCMLDSCAVVHWWCRRRASATEANNRQREG